MSDALYSYSLFFSCGGVDSPPLCLLGITPAAQKSPREVGPHYQVQLKDHAPSGAPALARYPSAASRRPTRTQLGAPNSRASGPRFLRTLHQTVPRAARYPPRGLTVAPLTPGRGATVSLPWGYGGTPAQAGFRG